MKLKKWFTHNLGLKIVSLVLSFFLWMYVYYVFGSRTTKFAYIQIQVADTQSNYHVNLNPSRIKVTYNGPMQLIETAEKELRAILELPEDISPGIYQRKPTLSYPKNIDIIEIDPEQIEVTIEKIIAKDFTIETNVIGKPKGSNIVGEIKLSPNTITIQASETTIGLIKKVMIDLDVTDASSDIFGSAEIKVLDEKNQEIQEIQLSEHVASFQIHIFTSDLTKTVPVIPQLVGTTSWMITSVTITPQVVTIKGPSAILEKITSLSTESIDINLLKGTLDKEIALVIPDQVELIETNTKFRIRITTEEMITIQLKDIPIQILPANHNKLVTLSDNKVNVAITGKKSVVEGWQKFQIFVNIEKLLNGEHTVTVQINQAPAECTIQIFPPKVTVKIMD
ncbi:hypothetical protein LLG10_00405 [bacterium]|nr:hypothetical protein [bacterium]